MTVGHCHITFMTARKRTTFLDIQPVGPNLSRAHMQVSQLYIYGQTGSIDFGNLSLDKNIPLCPLGWHIL
jgi:hypothetical protein